MNQDMPKGLKVYEAITNVMAALAKSGIAKAHTNTYQNYKFRGIDDVYNALSGELAKNKLCILPKVLERTCVERMAAAKQGKEPSAVFYVTVTVEFTFISSEDGSSHTIVTYGEAMDSSDKATNKAMSAAYKYAAMQAFCIPTAGDNDADASHHTVEADEYSELLDGAKTYEEFVNIWRTIPRDKRPACQTAIQRGKKRFMSDHQDGTVNALVDSLPALSRPPSDLARTAPDRSSGGN